MCRIGPGACGLRDDTALGRTAGGVGVVADERSRGVVQVAERCAGAKVLLWPTALGRRVNDVGSTAWERILAKDFKLEHTGGPGRLQVGPNGVQESAIDGVATVPLMTAVRDT